MQRKILLTRHKISMNLFSIKKCFSCSTKTNPTPVVILLPWLGAKKSGINKYKSLYESYGCDVKIHTPGLMDFIWPKTGLTKSEKYLKSLSKTLNNEPIIIHSFSIGCYFYALCMMHLNNKKFEKVSNNIVGQVIDSPVVGSLKEMALGVSMMLSTKQVIQKLIYQSCLMYFALSKPFTVKYYDQSINEIQHNPIRTNALVMSCRNDPMLQVNILNDMIDSWRKVGCQTTVKLWDKSEHAQHLRIHKDEYEKLIYNFLQDVLSKK